MANLWKRLWSGSELPRARATADDARDRAVEASKELERWCSGLRIQLPAVQAPTHQGLSAAQAAYDTGDLAGFVKARELCEEVRSRLQDARIGLAREHPRFAALQFLTEAKEVASALSDPEERSLHLSQIAVTHALAGDLAAARSALGDVEPGDQVPVLRAVAMAQASSDQVETALATTDEIEDPWIRDETRLSLVEERSHRGDVAGGREVAATLSDPVLRARAWRAVAAADARKGNLEQALATAREIEDDQWRAAAECDLAVARAKTGDFEGGLGAARSIADVEWRSAAIGELAAARAAAGDVSMANALLEEIEDEGEEQHTRGQVAEALAEAGGTEDALRTAESIEDGDLRALVLSRIAAVRKRAGDLETCRTIVARALEIMEHATLQKQRRGQAASLSGLANFLVEVQCLIGDFDAAETSLAPLEERQRAPILGRLATLRFQQGGGDLAAVQGLLDRHPEPREACSILTGAARGMLALASDRAAAPGTPATEA